MYFKLANYVMKVFLKDAKKNACFGAQNILDPFLSLHFIPKVLLNDQKILDF
jgi:hypothetical protein